MPTVVFKTAAPEGDVRATCGDGETLFAVAQRVSVVVATACVGKGNCGLCRVEILEGEAHLGAFTATESRHLGNVYFITKERLACQTRVFGEATVAVRVPTPRGTSKRRP